MLSYLTLQAGYNTLNAPLSVTTQHAQQPLPGSFTSFALACLTCLWMGVIQMISVGSGWHVAKDSHLVTWGLATRLIDDLRQCDLERLSL